MKVIENPTVMEIDEFLGQVLASHNSARYLLGSEYLTANAAAYLFLGWTFLFYDDEYHPLMLTNFTFTELNGKKGVWFNQGGTRWLKASQLLMIYRGMLRYAERNLTQGVNAVVRNPKIVKIALRFGFRETSRKGKDVYLRLTRRAMRRVLARI